MEQSKFYELSVDTIADIQKVIDTLALSFNLRIKMVGNTKLKSLIKLQKVSDIYSFLYNTDLILYFNEDYYMTLQTDTEHTENAEILMYQELDRLEFNIEKGTFKIAKYKVQTTTGVIKKFGIDAVANANEISELYAKQKDDKNQDKAQFANQINNISKKKNNKGVEFLN